VLPLVAIMVLGIIQVVVVARDQLAVELAAREGARAAAVSADPGGAATAAAERAVRLRPMVVSARVEGTHVTVDVSYRSETSLPLVGTVIPDFELAASVTMRREPP
jgi:Flp pilus assembly protein TadG